MKAYCVACRKKVTPENPCVEITKNKRYLLRGTCPNTGYTVTRFLSDKDGKKMMKRKPCKKTRARRKSKKRSRSRKRSKKRSSSKKRRSRRKRSKSKSKKRSKKRSMKQGYKDRKDESIAMRRRKKRSKRQLRDSANESYGRWGSKAVKSGKINR